MMSREVEADFLQLGHHGSNTSSDPAFIEAVDPAVAIYSASHNNSYGHPSPDVVSLIQNSGITLYGTDIHGTVLVTTDGVDYDVQTEARSEEHTSELQSRGHLVCRLLLEKKKKRN